MTSRIHDFFNSASARGWKRGRAGESVWKMICGVFLLCATATILASGQSVRTLVSFDSTTVSTPTSLVQATDGNFYGATGSGGAFGSGTVFRMTRAGNLTTLYSFCAQTNCADGATPWAGLIQASDGNFYGTTFGGGAYNNQSCTFGGGVNGCGTVFKMTPSGQVTTLYSFCAQPNCTDGANPRGKLIQASDGRLYGTTYDGGTFNDGTVFKITPGGKLTTIYSFCAQTNCADGVNPWAELIEATDGNFYGTTEGGGGYNSYCGGIGCGTAFRITPNGTLTTLHQFCATDCSDNQNLQAGLVQGSDGNFYGVTFEGGTVFRMTPAGTVTTLAWFDPSTIGSWPNGGLVQATDGDFYGTTPSNGVHNVGTAYRITRQGELSSVHNFCSQPNCADGGNPAGPLIQGTDGNLYGMSSSGGAYGYGTVFQLSMGLAPFVSFIHNSGGVGATAQILGQGFTGTSSVSFNGTPAAFTVVTGTYLKATVPAGATNGLVTVTTPRGTLTSNVPFRVTPQILSFSPSSGPVGTSVVITGESFTGANAVVLGPGQTAMSFSVDSDTQITAVVPAGATSGVIGVRTAGGRVTSATRFTVTP